MLPSPALPPGHLLLPGGFDGTSLSRLRLGTASLPALAVAGEAAPPGELWLAADLWEGLSMPLHGLRLSLWLHDNGECRLGPSVAILYPGQLDLTEAEASERLDFYFGEYAGGPGLMAIGFDQAIDWERGLMEGFVLRGQPDQAISPVRTQFPIPEVVRLTWSVDREVIRRLQERTAGRTFNWVRNIGKWESHRILRESPRLAPHLPATRLLRGPADLAVMLARYRTVFVKDVFSIQGRGVARIRLEGPGWMEVSRMVERAVHTSRHTDLRGSLVAAGLAAGTGRRVIQQGVNITGQEGRALDFRVLLVRDGLTGWRCPATFAKVAPDHRLAFTNAANGADEVEPLGALRRHLGFSEAAAKACTEAMAALCTEAATLLAERFDPLGIVGFDVAVERGSRRLWLLEANSVPGWGYGPAVDQELARSQVDYALKLASVPC